MNAIVPIPKIDVTTRLATLDDLPFIDGLQKMHGKMVGWMPTKALVGKINAGQVIVAEAWGGGEVNRCAGDEASSTLHPLTSSPAHGTPVGYCIGQDQYFKRDDVGVIYQLNVAPSKQRGLIGATLVKAMFERAAYGCKLFCCWCAQDIEANKFWAALGFVPLAFRAGSRAKDRVHIFWQRRIVEGDTTTPWWFPSKTNSGSIREDRLVLPIPVGVRWSDEMPRVLPGNAECRTLNDERKTGKPKALTEARAKDSRFANGPAAPTRARAQFGPPKFDAAGAVVQPVAAPVSKKEAKPQREPRQKTKNDPKMVSAARELRDRWLEQVNAPGSSALGTGAAMRIEGKYEVSRQIEEADRIVCPTVPRQIAA